VKRSIIAAAAGVALLVSAAPASAATSATGAEPASANVEATVEATLPTAEIAFGNIPVGATGTEKPASISVNSNATWGATILANNATMQQWDTTYAAQPGGAELTNAFEWKLDGGTYADITTTAASVVTGQAVTGATPATVALSFRQKASFADTVLTGGPKYRLDLTYAVGQGL
jgi:hypothetical protein